MFYNVYCKQDDICIKQKYSKTNIKRNGELNKNMSKRIEKCVICGTEIEVTNSRYKKSKTKKFTCSTKCMGLNSKAKNNCKCDNCGILFHKKNSHIHETNFCSMKCLGEYKSKNSLGKNNPNSKYDYDENFFKNIDTEFKAWFVGWIASDGCIGKNNVSVCINSRDIDVLKIIKNNFCKQIPIKNKNKEMVSYTICSKEIMDDLLKVLNLKNFGKKSSSLTSVNIPDNLIFHFIRGYLEGDGCINNLRTPACQIASNSLSILNFINEKSGNIGKITNSHDNQYKLEYCGVNALDFLGKLYNSSNYKMRRKYEFYERLCTWERKIDGPKNSTMNSKIYFCKSKKDAVLPFKERVSDSGYDLTLLSLEKKMGEVELYDTGIKVTPPFGYYFDLVPRSSIIKSGYILANNIGIIDRSYLGAIKVPLIKIDKNKPDLELPNRLVQIIPRKAIHCNIVEVKSLENTSRGDGGFGSTNKENDNE